MAKTLELSSPAVPVSVRELRNRVAEIASTSGVPARIVEDVRLCVSEAVTNAVRHAFGGDDGVVHVSVELTDDELVVGVRDAGKGLSEFRREGELGHGLRIIDALTQRCSISSAPGRGTEVVMVFDVRASERSSRQSSASEDRSHA
jgi:anti-sigma regulatory factor (Ser/Thr protein kinase)